MKKITKATIKSFIKKNQHKLFIKHTYKFDGMQDMVDKCENAGFSIVQHMDVSSPQFDYRLGIKGAYFVSGSRFYAYEQDGFVGFTVYNCCGEFIIAVK